MGISSKDEIERLLQFVTNVTELKAETGYDWNNQIKQLKRGEINEN
ncbi:MAG: hypothetical protein GX339_05360 [Tissierellia bacterium]|nr:hypothetical protein [Tissierellia bacterium]